MAVEQCPDIMAQQGHLQSFFSPSKMQKLPTLHLLRQIQQVITREYGDSFPAAPVLSSSEFSRSSRVSMGDRR
jgi:hypothetical protein